MKRHPALQDLSRDHHVVLRYCQRIRRAAPAEAAALAAEFLAFYATDMAPHFEEEDRFVVPAARATGRPHLVGVADEVHDDHEWFEARFEAMAASGDEAAAIMAQVEARLTRHVRMEEEDLFEGVQEALTEEAMQALWRDSFAYRSTHRVAAACTVRPGKD